MVKRTPGAEVNPAAVVDFDAEVKGLELPVGMTRGLETCQKRDLSQMRAVRSSMLLQ